MEKIYLGDGVYVDYINQRLVLTAEDGEKICYKIFLEREIFEALKSYAAKAFSSTG